MKRAALLLLSPALAALASSCATTPAQETAIPVNFVGCSSNVAAPVVPAGDPRAGLILFGLELGYDLTAYGTCVAGKLTQHVPDAMVSDGVYRSGRDTFSVSLPALPAGVHKPSISITQPTVRPSDYAMFWLMDDGESLKSGAIAYGVGTSEETAAEQSQTLEQVAAEEMHQNAMTTDRLGVDQSSLVHHEPAMLDGRPAMFAVYSSGLHPEGSASQPLYLITYFTRYQARSAAIVIFWLGDCPVCTEGREADIRQLDPGIGRFVDSFHVYEASIGTASAATAPHLDQQASPRGLAGIPVPPGKALIYFYREWHFGGGGIDFHVQGDGGPAIGALANGTYIRAIVDPGTYTFILSKWDRDHDTCGVQVKAGDIHYLKVFMSPAPSNILNPHTMLNCRDVADLDALTEMAELKPNN